MHSASRRIAALLLLSILWSMLPPTVRAQTRTADLVPVADVPAAAALQLAPTAPAATPNLTLEIRVGPQQLAVGDTTTITLVVANQAATPATNVMVSLPLPAGATPRSKESLQADGQGWIWQLGTLGAGVSRELTVELTLASQPTGDALLARAALSADGIAPLRRTAGALVTATTSAAPTSFVPGNTTLLRSADQRVDVTAPAGLAGEPLQLSYRTLEQQRQQDKTLRVPPAIAGFKQGFGTFYLDATDARGNAVHQFQQPVTIRVRYTPEQLEALGIAEADLTIFWFNEAAQRWEAQPTTVDPTTGTASTAVDHFSPFQLSDGSSPSEAFIPSLQGWQVGLYTGAASFSYPIEVPAGPGGLKPGVSLSYSSASADGKGGLRAKQQAGWVGKGWSLDTGSVSANKIALSQTPYYSLVFNGQSFDLVQHALLPGYTNPGDLDPTHWEWRATDESFIKVRITAVAGLAGRGGSINGTPYTRHQWEVWGKDGVKYEFQEDAWWGWDNCAIDNTASMEAYKWLLTNVTDTHGNRITYNYSRDAQPRPMAACQSLQGTVDRDVWPTSITWGGNIVTGATDRYKVEFVSTGRVNNEDTAFDGASNQYGFANGQPRETRRLNYIQVWSKPSTNVWQLVRQYNLGFDYSLFSDNSLPSGTSYITNTAYPKLTLKSLQRVGKFTPDPANPGQPVAGQTAPALPAMTFAYGTNRGTTRYANGSWNRLTTVNNGQGGTISFAYDTIANTITTPSHQGWFENNRRVKTKTLTDGRGNSAPTSYTYYDPAYNSLGTALGSGGPQQFANSAVLYYNTYRDSGYDNTGWLLRKAYGEFRGHSKVIETGPTGNQTEHSFYQGDIGANPRVSSTDATPVTGAQVETNATFLALRERELLKGKEYRTVTKQGTTTTLAEDLHTFTVEFLGYGTRPFAGLWRAFTYERETENKTWNGAASVSKRTVYTYDPALQGSAQYGNVTAIQEYTGATLYRETTKYYTIRNDATDYLVDRVYTEIIKNGTGVALARTDFSYDGSNVPNTIPTRGELTLVRKYYDLTPSFVAGSTTLHSSDTSYDYDDYGNRTHVTTYAAAGTHLGKTFSLPGSGSTPSTTITAYDGTFHAFSSSVTPAIAILAEFASYDERMGTLTSVTDPNGTITSAEYDAFGRMVKLIKPGDNSALPTVLAEYADTALPFRYTISKRIESSVSGSVQRASQFYDGLGRLIQTKSEVNHNTTSRVEDTQYNGLGQKVRDYRVRLQNDTEATIATYTPTPTTGVYSTTTTYDALGRVLTTLEPNGARTLHTYGIVGSQTYHDVVDPNRHRIQQRSDVFGRLVQVDEITGNCGAYLGYPCGAGNVTWAVGASTFYGYSPLDLLTGVTDAAGNQTTMTYDSLGRKLTMSDPDMGAWSYAYDVDGNLLTQTDAKNQTISFGYDALSRLTSKAVPGSGTVTYGYDETLNQFGSYNKGLQTSMTDASGTHTWEHDQRGQVTQEFQSIIDQGLTYQYTTGRSYDARGLIKSLTYPTGEQLTYSYDDAGQQKAITSSYGPSYLASTTYDALGQTLTEAYGNSVTTTNTYYAIDARLYNRHVTSPTAQTLFRRYYTYELGGNVRSTDNVAAGGTAAETLRFFYDERDRLTTACAVAGVASNTCVGGATFNQSYAYSTIGNLTSKAGVANTYPTNGIRPHAVSTVGGQTYSYDNNGNLLSGGGRTFTWNAENQPTKIVKGTTTEDYTYNGANERVVKVSNVAGVVTRTRYVGGLLEVSGTTTISSYGGIAIRTVVGTYSVSNPGTVLYLHGDHLGSVSLTTTASGALAQSQVFDPWGAVRSGGVTATEFNYTGQRKDAGSGLLFYNARYYDPAIGRFLSADSMVPTTSHRALTVDFHENGLTTAVAGENTQGFWFQLSGQQRRQAIAPWGASNPQELNRYAYVTNNPINATDPTGHETVWTSTGWNSNMLSAFYNDLSEAANLAGLSCLLIILCPVSGPLYAELVMGPMSLITEVLKFTANIPGATFDLEIGEGSDGGWLRITVRDAKGNIIATYYQGLIMSTSIVLANAQSQGTWSSYESYNSQMTDALRPGWLENITTDEPVLAPRLPGRS